MDNDFIVIEDEQCEKFDEKIVIKLTKKQKRLLKKILKKWKPILIVKSKIE